MSITRGDVVVVAVLNKDFIRTAKITSKYQVSVSKIIDGKYNLRPGDEIDWVASCMTRVRLVYGARANVDFTILRGVAGEAHCGPGA